MHRLHLSSPRRWLGALAASLLCSLALPSLAVVPTPVVTGPIPSDAPGGASRNYTFFATDLDLKSRGYVEEEFFIAGTANTYDALNPGGIGNVASASPTANVLTSGNPYRTRIVVRRPAAATRFNGTVVVEWMNATSNYDVEALWFRVHEFFMRDGYVWVGVTAQSGPITNPTLGLKAFSPARYASLDLTNGGTVANDRLSYDVYGQAMQAVRNVDAVLGPLRPALKNVVGAGVSQSAGRLSVYANAVHTRDAPVMDAALLYIGGQKVRTDLGVPVLKLLSETEHTPAVSEIPVFQPDTDKFRLWAMAGTSHSDWASFAVRYALLRRDQPTAPLADACVSPSRSRIPDRYVISAALDGIKRWVETGKAPPTATPMVLTSDGTTVQRDALGNGLGGIRLAPFAVPVALDSGPNTTPAGSTALCFLNGTHVPFDTQTLNLLYPTHESYVSRFNAAADKNVADGFVLPADADEMRKEAAVSITGLGLECGPLCANYAQFPIQPSTQLLRDHTKFLYLVGGDELLKSLDGATLTVARGYTAGDPAQKKANFSQSAKWLQQYKSQVNALRVQGNATVQQAALLNEYADTLITEMRKLGAEPEAVALDVSAVDTLYAGSGGNDDSGGGSLGLRDVGMLMLALAAAGMVTEVRRRREASKAA